MAQKRFLSPAQDMAATPTENIWVQANAGTGKTSVLVQRLLRILFRSSDARTGILCLTYTNAGAGEMRNRILASLRGWAMADDDTLRQLLDGVTLGAPGDNDLARAREIFFRYIDNPDMLKIKTIHGFCEEILHRFPQEAGLSPSWTLISDSNQKVLLQDAFNALVNSGKYGAVANDAFAHIVGRVSETYLNDLMGLLAGQYKSFFQVENLDNYRKYFIDTTRKFLLLDTIVQTDISREILEKILKNAIDDQNSLKKPVKYLENIINLTKQFIDKTIDFDEYKSAYLTDDGTPRSAIAKKDYLAPELERVFTLNQRAANEQIFADTIALFDLSAAFANAYRDMKRMRNVLDFDDLILYTRRLFASPDTMGWILSQLDLGLNHILVDEAQDTSPQQWDILRMLAGDFFTDGDATTNPHSMFVVGDTKQSIYGFQGADPHAFATSREEIASQIQNNMRTIREIPLIQSFRSTHQILETVDRFFADETVIGISNFVNNPHKCFRMDAPGAVELHALVSKQESDCDITQYIRDIADKIEELISSGQFRARDIMILVQKRNPMAAPMVAELKRRNIDVAGSDRIVLPNFPAIRDLLNLVRVCLNPADDYSLCCVLKSPLFRLNEGNIFNLCTTRNNANKDTESTPITILDVLRDNHPDIYTELDNIIAMGGNLGPYSFFTNILKTGREKIIAALSTQVIDPLEEFMTICLAYERTQPGTLYHFLKWFITGGSEIKRDMDESNGVRIVTVHGSKGLEAPVVFLVDTINTPQSERILPIPNTPNNELPTPWIWTARGEHSMQRTTAADEYMHSKIAEYYRLLYVAMTRARDQLYIYGFTPNKNPPANAWHTQLWRVLAADTHEQMIRIDA